MTARSRSVEERILLAAAGAPVTTTAPQEAACDWGRVEALARRHNLVPLLLRHAESRAVAMPKATYASLWARAGAIAARGRAMTAEMARVYGLLDAAGVRVIPYKGPTLALAAFGDVGLREFGDLDFLVRPSDALAAKALLAAQGYAPAFELPAHLEAALLASHRHYEYPLFNDARGVLVELHWRPDPEVALLPLDDEAWWARLPAMMIGVEEVRTLPLPDLVLVLALHGTKHAWCALSWLADLAALLPRCTPQDWGHMLGTARRLECERRFGLGLRLARELLGVPLPADAAALADVPAVAKLARTIEASLFAPEPRGLGTVEWVRYNLRLEGRLPRYLHLAARSLFEPGLGDWLQWRVPPVLRFLYYPLRLARLAAKYALRARG